MRNERSEGTNSWLCVDSGPMEVVEPHGWVVPAWGECGLGASSWARPWARGHVCLGASDWGDSLE